mgnify:CR=1 FL=1
MNATEQRNTDVERLNIFLHRERSAFEAYQICIERVDDPQICRALTRLRATHQGRVRELDRRIRALGGTPCAHSRPWKRLAILIERNSSRGPDGRVVVDALRDLSARVLRGYRESLSDLSPETHRFIAHEIIPDRQREHEAVVSLGSGVVAIRPLAKGHSAEAFGRRAG